MKFSLKVLDIVDIVDIESFGYCEIFIDREPYAIGHRGFRCDFWDGFS